MMLQTEYTLLVQLTVQMYEEVVAGRWTSRLECHL